MKLMTGLRDFFRGRTANSLPETQGQDGQAGETKPLNLTDLMSSSATGWAAIIDDVLDVRTISDSKNMCAASATIFSSF